MKITSKLSIDKFLFVLAIAFCLVTTSNIHAQDKREVGGADNVGKKPTSSGSSTRTSPTTNGMPTVNQ